MNSPKEISVACALIIDEESRVLAAQRSNTMSLPLKWEFPGGKIEPQENARQCLVREIKEELNIDVEIIRKLEPNTHCYGSTIIRLIPFICKQINGMITVKEHADIKWIAPQKLQDLDWAEADIPVVKKYLSLIA